MITIASWIHTSRGCGGGGGRLATLAALCLSTSRACLRAFVSLGGKKQKPTKQHTHTHKKPNTKKTRKKKEGKLFKQQ